MIHQIVCIFVTNTVKKYCIMFSRVLIRHVNLYKLLLDHTLLILNKNYKRHSLFID